MSIRPATWIDSMQLTAMWARMHHEITTRTAMLEENSDTQNLFHRIIERLNDQNWIILIAVIEDKTAGFIMGKVHWPPYSKCHIIGTCEAMYVYPTYRGKGIYKELINESIRIGKEKGAAEFEFLCLNDKKMVDFYDKLGFEPVQIVLRQKEIK